MNREASSSHAGNMTQHAAAESTVLLAMASCPLSGSLKHDLGALSDTEAMLTGTAFMAILDPRPSSWLDLVAMRCASRVLVLGRAS